MVYKRRVKRRVAIGKYSIVELFRKQGKTTPQFEVMLNSLTLEEIIALKLELATTSLGVSLYGIPIWHNLSAIVRDAAVKFALSTTRSKAEAGRVLGTSTEIITYYLNKKNIQTFFQEQEQEKINLEDLDPYADR